jgi:2-octaprenyl-6-methoxyphenol hydroxylase
MRVSILGDGLSSLTLANALVNKNIYVDVLAQKKDIRINHTRSIGITQSNINFFNKNIININKLLWRLKKIEIFSDNLKNEKILNFENKNNQLFSILKNQDLYQVLEKKLLTNKYFKKKKISNKDFSFINNYELIINCNYFHSITKKYFSKKIEKKYNAFAYTTTIKHKKILNDVAIQIFTKNGPLAFLPTSPTETSIVYSVQNSNKKINIEKLINKHNFKYKINRFEKIDSFELSSLNLRSYSHKNILAFGDLIHRIHPLAGQGFNMTIRDIKTLIDIIQNKYDLGLPLDNSVIYEFEKNLKYKNFIFSNGIDVIYEFFNFERKINNNFLSGSVKKINKNLLINKLFIKIADRGIFT